MLSYGPCQFPTLGFIVDRYKQIRDFKPEKFWYLALKVTKMNQGKAEEIKFEWDRSRVYDKMACLVLYEKCIDAARARVADIQKNRRLRYRP